MLFLNIYTYKEGKREAIIARRLEKGRAEPKGVKIIGEWTALDGSGGYMVFETDKPDYSWTLTWGDLLDMKVIPILDTEKDVIGLLKYKIGGVQPLVIGTGIAGDRDETNENRSEDLVDNGDWNFRGATANRLCLDGQHG
jgi:hypothetical protein